MKKLFLLNLILFLSIFLCGQNNLNDDAKARIGTYLKINPQILNVQISSLEAKSTVDIIVFAFELYFIIPTVSLNNIKDLQEKKEIELLISRLDNLLKNPPEWEHIIALQNEKKSKPPTPPVYAGDEKAKQYYNTKYSDLNKKSSGSKGMLIQNETIIEPPVPIPDKSKELINE
ncbi:MAG TPA: hypothetical protein GX402_06840 [Bacteroidales bacterium]|jgi:hypothetical protein|nr:hypothetical protein [Bacteroidales bacterium]HHW59943.1 hypothetical protein [Bacteroidales bacterium]